MTDNSQKHTRTDSAGDPTDTAPATEPRDRVRIRLPTATTGNTDIEVSHRELLAIAWHEYGGIDDALEVYPGCGTDDELVVMRDILGTDDDGADVFGPPFTVSREELNAYEFVAPDGDPLTPDAVTALSRRQSE